MKLNKRPLDTYKESQQRNFKFITVGKLELYSPKKQNLKIVSNKSDNKYKFPPINNQIKRKSNFLNKIEDFDFT